jgi:hypothetical protein
MLEQELDVKVFSGKGTAMAGEELDDLLFLEKERADIDA